MRGRPAPELGRRHRAGPAGRCRYPRRTARGPDRRGETLVELDIEYRRVAEQAGVPAYLRAATVGAHPAFIGGLADMVQAVLARGGLESEHGGRLCPADRAGCPVAPGERPVRDPVRSPVRASYAPRA